MKYSFTTSAICAALVATSFACSTNNSVDGDCGAANDGGGGTDGRGEGGASDGGEATDGGGDLGECVSYAPASISGKKTGVFTSAEVVKIPLPETDVGGGLLKVTYTQDAPVVGSLFLPEGASAADPRAETGAFGPGIGSGGPGVVYYRLAGKKAYELGVKPFSFDDTKANYGVEYVYEPLVDCYEANNSLAAAKRVPVNETITAYHHTGIDTNDTGSLNESGDDWYFFELSSEKRVKLKGVLPGKDGATGGNSALFTVYTADGEAQPACSGSGAFETNPVSDTEAVETCDGALSAGKYFVKLAHFVSQPSSSGVNESFNKSWNTAYTFKIEAQ